MRKILSKVALCIALVGSCMNVMGQEIQTKSSFIIKYDNQKGSTDYLNINGQIYVPFKWLLNEVGIQDFKWEDGKQGGNTKAYITVEVPAYFWDFYYDLLTWGLEPDEEGSTNMPLPDSLKGLIAKKTIDESQVKNIKILNAKPIDLTVTSQGYETGQVIYNYKIVKGTLYIPVDEVKRYFGIEGVTVDKATNKAVLEYIPQKELQTKLTEQIAQLNQKLKFQKPEDVLAVWIRGQQMRNGSLQYAMLCSDLQQKVLPEVKTRGWVTGGSSPSLRGGKVTVKNEEKVDDHTIRYTVQYESMLQGKVYETLEQVVELKAYEEEGTTYWCISKVTGDVGYYTYEKVVE